MGLLPIQMLDDKIERPALMKGLRSASPTVHATPVCYNPSP